MKQLTVISGKGGTGKTSLVAAFAGLAKRSVLVDADVDAADLHLILHPEIKKREEFRSGRKAVINPDACTQCGLCINLCRFKAVNSDYIIDPLSCEGCGLCVDLCPSSAIAFPEKICGEWFISETRFGPLVHARLGIAEENSGRLVTLIRRQAENLAKERGIDLILVDGPPGIGCPVISAVTGATAVLIITEPTLPGIHDLKRASELVSHFKIPAMVCINKFDINPVLSKKIEDYCISSSLRQIGKIPYDEVFTQAMIAQKTAIEFSSGATSKSIHEIWTEAKHVLQN